MDSLWDLSLLKVRITSKKASSKSCAELNFVRKSPWAHKSISPVSGSRGLQRSICLKFYNVQKWKMWFTLGLSDAENTQYIKKLQIKVVRNWILYKKVTERICLSPPRVEPAVSKDQYIWNLIMYKNGKLDSLWGSTMPKICISSKKASNKSCSELNFVQKSQWAICLPLPQKWS